MTHDSNIAHLQIEYYMHVVFDFVCTCGPLQLTAIFLHILYATNYMIIQRVNRRFLYKSTQVGDVFNLFEDKKQSCAGKYSHVLL